MTGRPSHSLRSAAPRRLLATPGWFLLVAASVALLTAAVAAPVLFLRAASDAALREELRTVEADAFASTSSGVRGSWGPACCGRRTDVRSCTPCGPPTST